MRMRMEVTPARFEDLKISITTSIGLAPLTGDAEATLAEADRALYEAKAAGRDRLSVAA